MIKFNIGGVIRKDNNVSIEWYNNIKLQLEDLAGLRKHLIDYVNRSVDFLEKDTENHEISQGIIVYPMIHIVHDELLTEEQKQILY